MHARPFSNDAMQTQPTWRFRSRQLGHVVGVLCLAAVCGDAFGQTEMLNPKSSQGGAVTPQQPAQQATAMRPDWAVNCATVQTELTCVASQSFFVKETGQRFMTVSVNPPKGDKKTTLVLQLPLGIYLPSGVSLQ